MQDVLLAAVERGVQDPAFRPTVCWARRKMGCLARRWQGGQVEAVFTPPAGPNLGAEQVAIPDAADLQRAVQTLPEHLRLVLVLRVTHALSRTEAAHELGISANGVEWREWMAVKLLRRRFRRMAESFEK